MFHGWAQLMADGAKFIQKEDIVPEAADRTVFSLAPGVALVPYLIVLVVIPFGADLYALDLDIGIFFVLAMSSIGVLGVLMAGWSSANKFSLMGALRAAAQLIAYELPLVLAAAAAVMLAASTSLIAIIEAQQGLWYAHPAVPAVHRVHDGLGRRADPATVRHAGGRLRDHLRRLHRVHGAEVRLLPAVGVRRHRGDVGDRRHPVPGRLSAAAGPGVPAGAGVDVRQDLRAVVRDRVAARDLPASARGPAAALRVDQAGADHPRLDPRRRVREGGERHDRTARRSRGSGSVCCRAWR